MEVKRADGTSEFYSYDYAGNMTRSTDAEGNTTRYEYNCTGQLARIIDPMDAEESYRYDIGKRLRRMTDRNGIVTTNHYEYDLWGNLAVREETISNRFLYTGQQYDGIIQQYYLRARYYNPVIARFTQEDTYRGDGQNLYTYCRNNPVCYVDPSGHCSKDPDGNQAGSGNDGELLLPAVIPTQPQLPAVIDTPQKQLPAVIDTPQKQLPAVINNYQNSISGPEADTPNNLNRINSCEVSAE